MRFFYPACKDARAPQLPPIPVKPNMPMRLRDYVSGKGDKSSKVACLQEMAIMLACFKTNEFDQQFCSKEISTFQKCYDQHIETESKKAELEAKGMLAGSKKLNHRQVTKLLRQYPAQ